MLSTEPQSPGSVYLGGGNYKVLMVDSHKAPPPPPWKGGISPSVYSSRCLGICTAAKILVIDTVACTDWELGVPLPLAGKATLLTLHAAVILQHMCGDS